MALYSTKALLHGKGGDVFEMIAENFPEMIRERSHRHDAFRQVAPSSCFRGSVASGRWCILSVTGCRTTDP
jgi:hypothetical protein